MQRVIKVSDGSMKDLAKLNEMLIENYGILDILDWPSAKLFILGKMRDDEEDFGAGSTPYKEGDSDE